MSEQTNAAPLSPQDDYWVNVYSELVERYQNTSALQAAPYMAVRLLTMRYGFDAVMRTLREKGVPWMAAQARQEMTVRQEFIARIVANFPPEDAEDIDGAAEEMARDLAALDCPEGGLRLLKYLDRLRTRELRFAERSSTVH